MQYKLSVVVVMYEMRREIARTLSTLSPGYQKVAATDYEVIIVDNGSSSPLESEEWQIDGMKVQYHYLLSDSPSPSKAINVGIEKSSGTYVAIMVDGARMLSPGILGKTIEAFNIYSNPFVTTISFHLGYITQQLSARSGYDQEYEDTLLSTIGWQQDGYRLFQISCFAESCRLGWFGTIAETNFFAVNRSVLQEINGADERFQLPGGGLVNHDLYKRISEKSNIQTVRLIGEGTFHQIHSGVTTQSEQSEYWQVLLEDYKKVTGTDYQLPAPSTFVLGELHPFMTYNYNASSFAQRKYREGEVRRNLTGQGVIILGMHRSGTSMLTGCLQEAGLFLGEVMEHSPHNLKGNRENKATWLINDQVVAANGGSWDRPVSSALWTERAREIRDSYLTRFYEKKQFGFKDPRCLLTLDGWREVIPVYSLVGIFRHPFLVANSLHKRNYFSYDKGLQLWLEYNWRLLYYIENHQVLLMEFTSDLTHLNDQIRKLCQRLGLPNIPDSFSFIEGTIVQKEIPEIESPKAQQCLDLYQKLQKLVDFK